MEEGAGWKLIAEQPAAIKLLLALPASVMLSRNQTRLLLAGILSLYLALAVGYGVVNPLFEAPDELHHFFAARYIAQTKSLPVTASASYLERQEAAQPPLYYVLASLIIAQIDTSRAEEQLFFNPKVLPGLEQPINVNTQVRTDVQAWPWREYPLAAHLVRMMSAVIGLGTLLAIFGSGRLLWPRLPSVALLATALVAFLPQFAFLHGAVTNDVLIIFFASFVLWQLLGLWYSRVTYARLLMLGISIGLAVLSKTAGLLLLPLAMLVLGLLTWRDRRRAINAGKEPAPGTWHSLILEAIFVAVPVLLLGGWLLWRNWTLYGDPTAANQFIRIAGGDRQFTLRQVWYDLDRVLYSAVAFFGWMNVKAPGWLYALWAAIAAVAFGGWSYALLRGRAAPQTADSMSPETAGERRLVIFWLSLWVVLVSGAWLRFMMQTPADQGRLMFPALLPIALFLARGILHWRSSWPALLTAMTALATSLYALLVLIPGRYYFADVVAVDQIAPQAARVQHEMGYGLQLLAIEPQTEMLHPGEWAWVDLYWRAEKSPEEAPFQNIALYGREHEQAGRQIYYHGGGNFPASEWPEGPIIKDRIAVQLAEDAQLPVELRLLLNINGEREPVEIARFKGAPEAWPEVKETARATFSDEIELLSVSFAPEAEPGSAVEVKTRWRVMRAPGRDLTTFVHLGDPAAAPLAQGDSPALGGEYPTGLWAAGELIDDHYLLHLPEDLAPGSYPVHLGFYDPQNGERLAVSAGDDMPSNRAFYAGMLTVKSN